MPVHDNDLPNAKKIASKLAHCTYCGEAMKTQATMILGMPYHSECWKRHNRALRCWRRCAQ